MTIWSSIGLIVLCAVCWDAGVVVQKLAADELPALKFDATFGRSIRAMVTSPKWVAGLVLSGVGWGLFAWALSVTPLSLARSIQGAGFVILAIFSVVFLRQRLSALEWGAVAAVTLGVAAIGLSDSGADAAAAGDTFDRSGLGVATLGALLLCVVVFLARRLWPRGLSWLVVYSIVAGTLLGLGDAFTKGLIVESEAGHPLIGFGFFGLLLVATYLGGVTLLTRAYQCGSAIVVTGVSDFCSRVATLAVGLLGLGERFPSQPSLFFLRAGGIAIVLVGTVVLARFSSENVMPSKSDTLRESAVP